MSYCCPQCSFTSQFESALMMHQQLHHPTSIDDDDTSKTKTLPKSHTMPRAGSSKYTADKAKKGFPLAARTSSATRLFDRLRARISRSRTLFAHAEETTENDLPVISESCTSKGLNLDSAVSKSSTIIATLGSLAIGPESSNRETFGCHLCSFDADRITVLDRHLLNDHKIGLDNLLKLVMAKTKDGLSENTSPTIFGVRQTYYKPPDEIIEEGEFVIETVTPKIKILKHAAVNTNLKWTDIPDLKDNCRMITKELEKLMKRPMQMDKDTFMYKMQTLNQCMCRFVDSTNTLKRVLTKDFDSKISVRDEKREPFFDLGLGDQDSPRDWERAHSEKLERSRNKYRENRDEKTKFSSESFYF